jgi:hypothetical protein
MLPAVRQHVPALVNDALTRTWNRLDDADRAAVHRYTCLNRTDPAHQAVMSTVGRQLQAEAGGYQMADLTAEFGLPARIADNHELHRDLFLNVDLSGTNLIPITREDLNGNVGVQVTCRVRDLPRSRFHAAMAIRITVVPCDTCELDCWVDPLAVVDPDHNTIRCLACVRWELDLHRRSKPR